MAGTMTLMMMMMIVFMVFLVVMMALFQIGSPNVVTHSDNTTKAFSLPILYHQFGCCVL